MKRAHSSLVSHWLPCTLTLQKDVLQRQLIRRSSSLPFCKSWWRLSTQPDSGHEHFFRYSSGRWLWDEEAQLRDRYKRFDVAELQKIAARSVGAQSCLSMTKLTEGGFNKVFRLVMDDGSVVIARIPNPNSGPQYKTTASEVATMDFALTVLDIPVPKVLSWCAKEDNAVQSEYILMEEASGTQLGELWDELELQRKLSIVEDIINIEKTFMSLSFTRYGNIYFSDDSFPGCEKAEIEGEVPQSLKAEVERRFKIGPVVDRNFWDGERAHMDIDRGPWSCAQSYLKAIAQREINWLSRHAAPRPQNSLPARSEAQCSPEAHISLYEKFLNTADYLLPKDKELLKSTLWHWDIHASNIFVKDDKISGLIDWQDAWAGPLLLQARHPRLVDHNGEFMLKLPPEYETLEDEEEKAHIRSNVEKSIMLWAYESDTKKVNPVLHKLMHLPQGRTRRDAVDYSANTWDGDIIPFRQCLIRIEKHWNEIYPEKPCPFTFSEEDIEHHLRDGHGWNENLDFWDSVAHLVLRDGWTSNENYQDAMALFAQLRVEGLKSLSGKERREFELQTRWAVKSSRP